MMYAHGPIGGDDETIPPWSIDLPTPWPVSSILEADDDESHSLKRESSQGKPKKLICVKSCNISDTNSGWNEHNMSASLFQHEQVMEDSWTTAIEEASYAMSQAVSSTSTTSLSRISSDIGWVHFSVGQYEDALYYASKALQEYEGTDSFLAASLWCNVGLLLYLLDKSIDKTIYALTKSFQILSNVRFPDDRQQRDMTTVQALLLLAHARTYNVRDQGPVPMLNSLIELRAQLGCEHPATVEILRSLGTFYMVRGLFEAATTFVKEAVRVLYMAKSNDADLLVSLVQLGRCHQDAGNYVEALSSYEEAVNLKRNHIWSEPIETKSLVSTIFYNMGTIHSTQSRRCRTQPWSDQTHQRETSLQCFHACLELRKSCYGADHPSLGNVLHNIAIMVLEDGDVSTSLIYFEESLRVWSKDPATFHHGGVASSLRYMAYIYKDQADFHQAHDYFTEALETLRRVPYDCSNLLIEVLVGLGLTQRHLGQIDQASKSYEEAAQLLRERTQLGNRDAVCHMVRLLTAMGNLAMELSETEAAHAFFTEAAHLDPEKDEEHPRRRLRMVELSPNRFPRHAAAA